MSRYLRTGATVAAALVALAAGLALAGCGGATTAGTASPAATQSGSAGGSYGAQAQAILSKVATTAGTLPDAVAGLSKTADDTWLTSGAKLNEVAKQLGDEADSLAALTPPSALQPVQDAVVKGLQAGRDKVNALSGLLYEQSADEAAQKGPIPKQVSAMQAGIQAVTAKLSAALAALQGASPAP